MSRPQTDAGGSAAGLHNLKTWAQSIYSKLLFHYITSSMLLQRSMFYGRAGAAVGCLSQASELSAAGLVEK